MRRETGRNGRTASLPEGLPWRALHRWRKVLGETEFYAFTEKVFALPEVKGLLMAAVNEHNRSEQKEGC
jgi:hypothetical protein